MDRSSPRAALLEAIEHVYAIFACYRLDPHLSGCPCCVKERDRDNLAAAPLRKLAAFNLELYHFKAMTTWGTEADFKHFLPRLLEIELLEGPIGPLDDLIVTKLLYARFSAWPENEKLAVRQAFEAWGRDILCQFPNRTGMADCIIAMARLFGDAMPLLNVWQASLHDRSALLHLATATDLNFHTVSLNAPGSALAPLLDFLANPTIEQALVDAYLAAPEGPDADLLAEGADRLHFASIHRKAPN